MAGEVATTQRKGFLLPALAVVGTAFVLVQFWGIAGWLLSDGFVQHDVEETVPQRSLDAIRLGQFLMQGVALVWVVYLVIDTRRHRTLTWPVLLTFAWFLTYWQESFVNVTGSRFAYNSAFFDRGDWTPYLPFVSDTGPGLPTPLLMQPFFFFAALPALALGIAAFMCWLRRVTGWRSPWVLGGIAFVVVLVIEFVAEYRSIAQEVHSYPEAFGALTLHAGEPNQFPLYENWLLGLMWFLPGLVLFLVRDHYRVGDLPPQWRPGVLGGAVTVLAAVGALNLAFMLYNLIAFVWLPADTVAPMPPWLTP